MHAFTMCQFYHAFAYVCIYMRSCTHMRDFARICAYPVTVLYMYLYILFCAVRVKQAPACLWYARARGLITSSTGDVTTLCFRDMTG